MGDNSAGRPGLIGALVVTLAATAAIVATYSRLSHTWDEGTHVSAGIEFLQDGRYTVQSENPPLARVALAVIPYLRGARVPPPGDRTQGFAVDVFYRTPDYVRNVTEARLANLIFFWLCVAFTWVLAGGRSDPWAALLASAAVATLPPIVAHSGFATTDVPFLAAFLLALIGLRRLLARPGIGAGALFGVALGLAIATKFSTLVFFPPAAAAIVACDAWPCRRDWLRRVGGAPFRRILGATAAVTALVVWAGYGFHIGRLADLPTRFGIYGVMPETGWPALIRDWPIPGHEFVHGLLFLRAHTIAGHAATLLGEFSQRGFVLYYPIVLLTKTPLPFLLFAAAGLWALLRSPATPARRFHLGCALGALGILIIAMASPINLGVRHVLVLYPLVALAAAHGLARRAEPAPVDRRLILPRWISRRWILGGALACLALQSALLALSVPNQIAYFNVLAGREPAFVSSDSDFDWGQDMLALERYVATHPIPELYVALNGTTRACSHHLPPLKALPTHPVTGWIAVSERIYRLNRGGIRRDPCGPPGGLIADPGWLDWLKPYRPVAIVGKTVRLYHIEPPPGFSDADRPASSPPG